MRNIVFTTVMALIGGFFTAGLVLAASNAEMATDQQEQQYGTSSEARQQQPQMAALPLNERQVRELQNTLNDKGFAVESVDGIIGPKTTTAIRNFQREEGLATTGLPDMQTLKALGINVGEQEFTGVAPEFGEKNQPYQPEQMPMEPMERTDQMPMQQMEQQPQSPGSTENK